MYIERSSKALRNPSISGPKHDTLWSVLHRKTEISIWWLSPNLLNHHFPCKHIRCCCFPSFYFSFLHPLHQLKTVSCQRCCWFWPCIELIMLSELMHVFEALIYIWLYMFSFMDQWFEGVFSHQTHSNGS